MSENENLTIDDPKFKDFASVVKSLMYSDAGHPTLARRCFVAYACVEDHPLVKLARWAQRVSTEAETRGAVVARITDELHGTREPDLSNRVNLVMAVYDAAIQKDTIALREAVRQAGKTKRSEWREEV